MRNARMLAPRLARIAELQSLRAMASKTRLAEAQRRSDEARLGLESREREIAERAEHVERCFSAPTLDLAALGIGRAMLAALAGERDRASEDLDECEASENSRRKEWLGETRLAERAREMERKSARYAVQKREDEAVIELAGLGQLHAGRWRA